MIYSYSCIRQYTPIFLESQQICGDGNMTLNDFDHSRPKLGQHLRAARELRGFSQYDLAEKLGKDQRSISQMENDKRTPSVAELLQIADILDVSIVSFFEGALTPNDLDLLMLQQLNRLPTANSKRAVIELVRLFCDALEAERPS